MLPGIRLSPWHLLDVFFADAHDSVCRQLLWEGEEVVLDSHHFQEFTFELDEYGAFCEWVPSV
jgi:hypothetical protein